MAGKSTFKFRFSLALAAALLFVFSGVANAASTYSSGTITVSGAGNTLDTVYAEVNNPAVLSKSGNEYILTANIVINSGASLVINGATLKFNEPANNTYGITNSGTLNMSNAAVTSLTGNAWYYLGRTYAWYLNIYPRLYLTNADLSVCGQGTSPCIQIGEYPVYEATTPIYLEWTNIKFHHNLGNYFFQSYQPFIINISDSEFYNLTTSILTGGNYRNSKFHDLDTQGSWGRVILDWGSGDVFDSEFYDINVGKSVAGSLFYCKEGTGGCRFQNNRIHHVTMGAMLGFYGSEWSTPTIISDNIIEDSVITDDGAVYWRANQYLGGINLTSRLYNNVFKNMSGPGRLFSWHSGGRNVRIWNNTIINSTVSGYSFRADYQASQAGGGIYHPGDSEGSILYDINFPGAIRIYDLDDPANQSIRGKLLPFVNVNYSSVTVNMPDDYFYDYKYLDVKVVDSNNNPISGATITVTNNVNTSYPAMNMYRAPMTSLTTGPDGHTPLPSDLANTAAILDFWKTSAAQQEMNYTITAAYNGSVNSTIVVPDSSWYRLNPNIPTMTITIVLPTELPPDTTSPTIFIDYPANNSTLSNTSITVNGTAFDTALSKVEARIGTGIWQLTSGTTLWSIPLTLLLGTNIIYANASDAAGNYNETSVTVDYYPITATPYVALFVNLFNTSLSGEIVNFTANATGIDVNFSLWTLKPNANYSIKKDGTAFAIVRADPTGKITFNNSIW